MAKVELKINIKDALEKIEKLNTEVDKFKIAMFQARIAANGTAKAMHDFVEACNNIDIDLKQ